MAEKPAKFIPELEGLRGLLALWVFIFHAIRFSGLHVPLLSEGGLAVEVFILLSGFMIARLWMFRSESYPSSLLS
jgi:peptidoglycan/LPS O-acetylase OafA/YrhL